jgi:HK97 family phage portal protein
MNVKRVSFSEAFGGVVKSSRGYIEGASLGGTVSPVYLKVSDDDAYDLFRNCEWLFATIGRIVNDCVKVPVEVKPKDRSAKVSGRMKNRIRIVEKFLESPNENEESFESIREKVIRDLLVWGRGAIEKVLDNGTLVECYALISKNISINSDEHGNLPPLNCYTQKVIPNVKKESKPVSFNRDEMIYVVETPISSSLYGLKKIDVLASVAATELLREAYNSTNFTNGAEASGILGVPGLSRTELKKFRQYWEARFKGAENGHRLAIVTTKDINFVRMALTNKDMEFSEYGKEIRDKIFAIYGMQPFVMGVSDGNASKLGSGEQIRAYKDGALRPILRKEARAYTKGIVEKGFGFDDIKISFGGIDLEDLKAEAEVAQIELTAGAVTINEYRNRKGMAPVPWGDTPLQMSPGGGQVDPDTGRVIPPSQQPNGPSGKPAAKPAAKPENKPAKKLFQFYKGKQAKITFDRFWEICYEMKRAAIHSKEDVGAIVEEVVDENTDVKIVKLLAVLAIGIKSLANLQEDSSILHCEIDSLFKKVRTSGFYRKMFTE